MAAFAFLILVAQMTSALLVEAKWMASAFLMAVLVVALASPNCSSILGLVSQSSVVINKHGLYAGGPGSITTTVTTMTAAGGDAEHVSLNH